MTQTYEILVCPVCGEQSEEDYEYGSSHWHDEWGDVEMLRLKVGLPPEFAGLRQLALFGLQEQKREQAFKLAERRVWEALPQEEKDRREAERRSKLSPLARNFEDLMRQSVESLKREHERPRLLELIGTTKREESK